MLFTENRYDRSMEKMMKGIPNFYPRGSGIVVTGNGRFVRNVLELAIIKQSSRIVSEYKNETFDKMVISTLSASDFDINAAKTY